MTYYLAQTDRATYVDALATARQVDGKIAHNTVTPDSVPQDATYVVSNDGHSGFFVDASNQLCGVFSTRRGRGDTLLTMATEWYSADSLNCFDVPALRALYERHGFEVYLRERNWTPGGPDVVFMTHPANVLDNATAANTINA